MAQRKSKTRKPDPMGQCHWWAKRIHTYLLTDLDSQLLEAARLVCEAISIHRYNGKVRRPAELAALAEALRDLDAELRDRNRRGAPLRVVMARVWRCMTAAGIERLDAHAGPSPRSWDADAWAEWERRCIRDHLRRVREQLRRMGFDFGPDPAPGPGQHQQRHTPFTRTPAPAACWAVLGVAPGATEDQVRAAYRRLALEHHPDRGGDHARFAEVNKAFEEALALSRSAGQEGAV